MQEMKLSQYHSNRLNFIYLFMILLRIQFLNNPFFPQNIKMLDDITILTNKMYFLRNNVLKTKNHIIIVLFHDRFILKCWVIVAINKSSMYIKIKKIHK